jgi:hypothetical protein
MKEKQKHFSLIGFFEKLTTKQAIWMIVIIGFAVYFNMLFNGFVWDDLQQLVNNNFVHSLANLPRFFSGSTFYVEGTSSLQGIYYRPVILILYSVFYSIFGPHAFFFHSFQLLLHVSSGILLFLFFMRYFKKTTAFIFTLIFLVHPINVESVVYISALSDTLFVFFGLLTLYLIPVELVSFKNRFIIFVLLSFSLLSKETGFLFLFIIPLYVYLLNKKNLVGYVFISLTTLTVYLFLRFSTIGLQSVNFSIAPIVKVPLHDKLITIPAIVFYYFKNLVFPSNLSICQQWVYKTPTLGTFYLPLLFDVLILATLAALGIYFWKKKISNIKLYLFFFIWTVAGIAFHLPFFAFDFTVSIRWFYFSMIGLMGLMAVIFDSVLLENSYKKKFIYIILYMAIVALGIKTIIRNSDWRDGLTLFGHDSKINQSFDLENLLGVELFKSGQIDLAINHFQKSINLMPNWSNGWNNLGYSYMVKSDIEKAEVAFQKAIDNVYMPYTYVAARDANDVNPYRFMAELLFYHKKNFKETLAFLDRALIVFPENAELWQIKVLAEYKLGNQEEALTAATTLAKLNPSKVNLTILEYIKAKKEISIN